MSVRFRLPLAFCALALVWGCDSSDVAPTAPSAVSAGAIDIGGYAVTAVASADGRTFTYTVDGSGAPANLNYVFIEDACAAGPTAYVPSNAVAPSQNTDADTTLAGTTWQQGLGEGQMRDYSVTYADPQELGAVMVVIRAGSQVSSALVPGACGNLFDLGGSVYVDDDGSGAAREPGELGIQNVLVRALDAGGAEVGTALTDGNGDYAIRLLRGDYQIVIPAAAAGAFNATLTEAYNSTTSLPLSVALNADVDDADVGYDPIKEVILAQLSDGGDFVTNGEEVDQWKRWIRRARRGQSFSDDGVTTTAAEVEAWLDAIFSETGEGPGEYFGNAVPYVLPAGADPFDAALGILSTRINRRSTDEEVVFVELFAMQLNFLSGRGSGDALYDETLIEFYEEQFKEPETAAMTVDGGPLVQAAIGTTDRAITRAFNGGGGGGEVGD